MVMHIFVCALVCVLFLFSLINVNDAVLQQEQPARRRRSAMNTMDNICKNYKKFLKCDEISIEYHQGTYGLGTSAEIDVAAAKAKNFSLYRNLNLDDTQTPIVDKEKLVPENRKLFVFIKTPLVETRSYSAPPESLAYFGQERERTRRLTASGFTVAIYDFYSESERAFPFLEDFLITQYFEGDIISDILDETTDGYYHHVGRLTNEVFISGKGWSHPDDGKEEVDTVIRAIWSYTRQFYMIIDSMLAFVIDFWKQDLRHCDFHAGNIMLLKEQIFLDQDLFPRLLKKGHIMLSQEHQNLVTMNPETVLPFLRQNGIDSLTVRILHPSRYRAIDLSFAEYCPWTPLDRMSPRRRAVHTPSPCLRHRNRREDIVELERIISKTCALGEGLRSKLKSAMSYFKEKHAESDRLRNIADLLTSHVEQATATLQYFCEFMDKPETNQNLPWLECLGFVRLSPSGPFAPRVCSIEREVEAIRKIQNLIRNEFFQRISALPVHPTKRFKFPKLDAWFKLYSAQTPV